MHFVLIRHGQSTNNLIYAQTGVDHARDPDTRLTDLGHDQAARLATLAGNGGLPWTVSHVYSSLMSRAIQTAAPLADALDLPLHAHPQLFECGGPYEIDEGETRAHPGSGRDDLAALSTRLVLPDEAGPEGWWRGPFEGEPSSYVERAVGVVTSLRDSHEPDDVVALVTHGWFTQYLLRELLGIGDMVGWFRIHNTGISLVRDETGTWAGRATAERLNWLPHLQAEHVSD